MRIGKMYSEKRKIKVDVPIRKNSLVVFNLMNSTVTKWVASEHRFLRFVQLYNAIVRKVNRIIDSVKTNVG